MNFKTCSKCGLEKPIDQYLALKKDSNHYRLKGVAGAEHNPQCRPCKALAAKEWRKSHPNYRGTGKLLSIPKGDRLLMSAISDRLMQAKSRVKKLGGLEPTIDREYLYLVFKKQQGLCALSGVTLKVEKHAVACLSLDKIIPELGYVTGNVQWVAWAVNRAKGDMSGEIFLDMCEKVLNYQKVQRLS